MDDFERLPCPNCKVHYGFKTMWDSFSEEMLNYTSYLIDLYPSASIIVTGHSLGGALSTLAAYDT